MKSLYFESDWSTVLLLTEYLCSLNFIYLNPTLQYDDIRRWDLFSSVQLLTHVRLFVTPWTAARKAFLSITNSWSLLQLMSIESVMPSNYLILCCLFLLLSSIIPSIRVISNESVLHIRCPKNWSFSFSISPSKEYSGLIFLGWTGWISLQSKGLSRVFSKTTVQKHQFFGA